MSKYRQDALSLLLLVLLILAFFWPVLSGRYALPHGGGDQVSFLWPTWHFAATALRQGVVPLWNPTLYAGAPFAADNQSSLFYPVNLLLFLVAGAPGYQTLEALVILHMALAAVLMYLLLCDKGLSRGTAMFGGLAFGLSDLFVMHIGNLNLNATIAYLPGVILLADRAFIRHSWGWAGGAGALLAVAALAGHGQMLLFIGLALALLTIYRLAAACRQGAVAVLQVAGLAAIVAGVGIAGAAVALYPSYELVAYSMPAGLSLEEASRFSLPPTALVGLLAPGFYGRGVDAFWCPWDRVEVGYLGVLPLALALAGLLPRGKGEMQGRQGFPAGYFAALAALSLLLALGNYTPLYAWVHKLPLLQGLRAPARLIVLTDLGLAGLAAYALDRIGAARRVQLATLLALALGFFFLSRLPWNVPMPADIAIRARWATTLAAFYCVLGLLWVGTAIVWPKARWLMPAAVAILASDLIASGSLVEVDRGDPWQGYRHDDVVAWLQSDPGLYRIDSSAAHAWQPDAAAMYGLYDISGVPNPLGLATYETYRWSISARGDRLYSLLGVKYVLADKGNPPGDQRLEPVYTAGPDVDIYLNTTAYPLAQFVYRAQQVAGAKEAFEAIHAPDFDPAQLVVLQETPEAVQPPGDEAPSLSYSEYSGNRLVLDVYTPTPAYLLLSEVYYPGWQASIDGKPVRVLPADYLFRAVYVPAGKHQVRLWFSPASLRAGLWLSLATWLGLIVWAMIARMRRRQPTVDTRAARVLW